MENLVQSRRPRTNAFSDFFAPPVQSIVLPRKGEAMPYEPVWQVRTSKSDARGCTYATPLRKLAPWAPTISDEDVSLTAPATRHASLQNLCKCDTPAMVFENATKPTRLTHLWEGAESIAPAAQNDAWTCKSGPDVACFFFFFISLYFHFEMCFAQRRPEIFRHLNFQKWSEHVVFVPLAICFSILRSHETLEKHDVSRLFYLFARDLLSSSFLFSDLLSSAFSDSSHLCFSSCPYCRTFDL